MPRLAEPLAKIVEKYHLSPEESSAALDLTGVLAIAMMNSRHGFEHEAKVRIMNATWDLIAVMAEQYRQEVGTGL